MKMLILATDMAKHGDILEQFRNCLDNFDYKNKEHVDIVSNNYAILCHSTKKTVLLADTGR
jgi:hypothetical protein